MQRRLSILVVLSYVASPVLALIATRIAPDGDRPWGAGAVLLMVVAGGFAVVGVAGHVLWLIARRGRA